MPFNQPGEEEPTRRLDPEEEERQAGASGVGPMNAAENDLDAADDDDTFQSSHGHRGMDIGDEIDLWL